MDYTADRESSMTEKITKNALALKYKGDYGGARGNLNVADLINNPAAGGKCRVFGPGFSEEITDLRLLHVGVLLNDRADPALVAEDSV